MLRHSLFINSDNADFMESSPVQFRAKAQPNDLQHEQFDHRRVSSQMEIRPH